MTGFIIFKNFIFDPLLSILYFPLWWYSQGLVKFFNFLKKTFKEISCPFVLKILLANLFKPMYGDYSREGRIISFFMRLFHLGWRMSKIILVFILCLIIFLIYIFLPIFIFYKIICLFKNSCLYFFYPPIL
ncbi:MAG: hypothetical protein ACK413_02520 [Patescibacteria group bacterium]